MGGFFASVNSGKDEYALRTALIPGFIGTRFLLERG
jgi:hypothetical protein